MFTKASTTTREKSGLTAVATSADVRMPRINTTSVQRGQLFISSMYFFVVRHWITIINNNNDINDFQDVASTLTFLLDVHTSPIPKTLAAVSHNAV